MFKALARLFGYELIHRRKSPTLEAHLGLILRQRAIDLVIDVGANAGQFGAGLRRIGYQGRILSFEPVASTCLLYTSPSPRDLSTSRMPSSA